VAGGAYYRWVKGGGNGAVNFTDTKLVDRSVTPATYYTVYPNPVQGILNINISAAGSEKTTVDIYDLNGRRMIGGSYIIISGKQTLALDMSSLGKGTYILKMTLGGKTRSQLVNKF